MSVRSTGIVVSGAAALVLLTYAGRTISPTTAEAVTQEQRKPSGERTRNAARTPRPERRPGAADHPPVDQSASPAGVWSAAEIVGALRRVAGVEIAPPTLVNCRVAAKLHEWIETKLQPLAESVLGGGISRIVSASGYSCRPRVGNTSGKQSEHSYANAFDVAAFTTNDGRTIDVLSAWGPTARDLQAQAQVPAQAAIAGGDARPLTDAAKEATAQKSLFLRKVHESACGIFTTVLGPEANEAHRNHLHLDLAQRRISAFCE